MIIPPLTIDGDLPPGEHSATLEEIEFRFGMSSERRIELHGKLRAAIANFKNANVPRIWLDGSFTTNKLDPNDIDGCWEYRLTVDLKRLDPVFLMASRSSMKVKYGLDFFIANWLEGATGLPFPRFFQQDRDGKTKGIIVLEINP